MTKKKQRYKIANIGCDDSNWFDMFLSYDELQLIIKLFEENNKCACSACTPHLFIFDYEDKLIYEYDFRKCLCYDYYDF